MAEEPISAHVPSLENPVRCLSIRAAARVLGVTERSVYSYLKAGKLSSTRVEGITVLVEEEVRAFVRNAPGRVRTVTPRWRLPAQMNALSLTTIFARVLPGCEAQFDEMCVALRASGEHRLPGTSARYLGREQDDPGAALILLVWREAARPEEEQRAQALTALEADFSAVLDWSTALITEGQVVLHAG